MPKSDSAVNNFLSVSQCVFFSFVCLFRGCFTAFYYHLILTSSSPISRAPFVSSSLSASWNPINTTHSLVSGYRREGGLCSGIDLWCVHQTDEAHRSLPGRNTMHDTLICHALASKSPAAKPSSWLPAQLCTYSLSSQAFSRQRHKMAALLLLKGRTNNAWH